MARAKRTLWRSQRSKHGLSHVKAIGNLDKIFLSGIQKLDERTQNQKGQYTKLISGKARIFAKVIFLPVL